LTLTIPVPFECGGGSLGFCVGRLFVVFGLLVGALVFMTAQASAHADHDDDTTVSEHAGTPAGLPHGGDVDHDVDHNPADHSHPIGEDTYHEKASHSSLDFAHYHNVVVRLGEASRATIHACADEAACGLVPSPPIRPPLA
jgi:hypothetical protein